MGGLGSGRARKHVSIGDCLVIDMTWLRKRKLLKKGAGTVQFALQWRKWTEQNFEKRTEHVYHVSGVLRNTEQPALILAYNIKAGSQAQSHVHKIHMTSTPCHYGGQRWWFVAPCCQRRVRVLYINPKASHVALMTPLCRDCAGLHYASQQQSYIEAHKSFERYLLANYGYTWASMKYHLLKEHYQTVTPELAYMARRSQMQRDLELTRHMIRCQRVMLHTHLHALASLKSAEDRKLYVDHLLKEHGQNYVIDLVRMLKISTQMDIVNSSPGTFEEAYMQQIAEEEDEGSSEIQEQIKSSTYVMKPEQVIWYLAILFEKKRDLERELKDLKKQLTMLPA